VKLRLRGKKKGNELGLNQSGFNSIFPSWW